MRDTIRSIYQGVTIVLLAMGLSTPGCGSGEKSEHSPTNITEAKETQSFEAKLAAVSWLTHTVDGDLLIGNSPGRDPSTPLLITDVFPALALTKDGAGLSLLPSEAYQATLPLRVVASGDIVLDHQTHLRVPGSLSLKGRRVIIKEGARLDVSGKLFIEAEVYSGHGNIIANMEMNDLIVRRAGRDGVPGVPGRNGADGIDSTCNRSECIPGKDGTNGTNGGNGTDGGDINLKIDYLDSSDVFITRGGNGGDGGNGGAGGRGGHQSCCLFDCRNGCPGGAGGNGANGGDGGQGGNITVEYCTKSSHAPVLDSSGGRGGQAGMAGVGGEPSNGGCAWHGCVTHYPTVNGVAGRTGNPGWDGITTVLRRKDCP